MTHDGSFGGEKENEKGGRSLKRMRLHSSLSSTLKMTSDDMMIA